MSVVAPTKLDSSEEKKVRAKIEAIDKSVLKIFIDASGRPKKTIKVPGKELDAVLGMIDDLAAHAEQKDLKTAMSSLAEEIAWRESLLSRDETRAAPVTLLWNLNFYNYKITGEYSEWTLTLSSVENASQRRGALFQSRRAVEPAERPTLIS